MTKCYCVSVGGILFSKRLLWVRYWMSLLIIVGMMGSQPYAQNTCFFIKSHVFWKHSLLKIFLTKLADCFRLITFSDLCISYLRNNKARLTLFSDGKKREWCFEIAKCSHTAASLKAHQMVNESVVKRRRRLQRSCSLRNRYQFRLTAQILGRIADWSGSSFRS